MKQPIRLGIVGTGRMASRMMKALAHVPAFKVTAVASAGNTRARAFAETFNVPNSFSSAGELADHQDVDAVYICGRNASHADAALAAINAGKPVLLEKPLATSLRDAISLFDAAQQKNALLVENLWCLTLPAYRQLFNLRNDQTFGEPSHLQFSFGYPVLPKDHPSLFDPKYGGVLLDRAVYGVSLALSLFGPERLVRAIAVKDENGVDVSADISIEHLSGAVSQISVSLRTLMSNTATLSCAKGFLRLDAPVIGSESLVAEHAEEVRAGEPKAQPAGLKERLRSSTLLRRLKRLRTANASRFFSYGADQYAPALLHFSDLIRANRKESDLIPPDLSLGTQRVLELCRQQVMGADK